MQGSSSFVAETRERGKRSRAHRPGERIRTCTVGEEDDN